MRAFINFWKKDMVNKLIVLLALLLLLGTGSIVYLLINMPKNSQFYSYFRMTTDETTEPSPETVRPLPSLTEPSTPDIRLSATPLPATVTPTLPSPTVESPTPTASLIPTPIPEIINNISCIPNNLREIGRAVEIIDGNTIRAYIEGKVYVVRYIGINVPKDGEIPEPFGREATLKNTDLVYAKDIILFQGSLDKDPRGRLLRYVMAGDAFVNFELVSQGFALALDTPPNSECAELFRLAQENAIARKTGMWTSSPTLTVP